MLYAIQKEIFKRISTIVESAQRFFDRSVNIVIVQAYWLIDREIIEREQQGQIRADYENSF
ncbi:MAG: DUF1016 domain-containing protein [Cyanothece sp. SIO1E1]|nr:DUF1016 domain-containing protein [Cyanothece sp. SIO1E1]